jgi:hypothetical protein
MLMMLVGIMVSELMLLLVGCDAGADERFVEPKLLERLIWRCVVAWRKGWAALGVWQACAFGEDGGGSGRLRDAVALAPDLVLKKLGGLIRPIFLLG